MYFNGVDLIALQVDGVAPQEFGEDQMPIPDDYAGVLREASTLGGFAYDRCLEVLGND